MGVLLVIQTAFKLARFLLGWDTLVDPKNDGEELAVIITGCDSGFGQKLAFALAQKGYVVFAGCLSPGATKQFEGESRIISMIMDVTKDDQVQAAANTVNKWLVVGDGKTKRYLHACVNNAGIGHGGLVDWLDLTTFQQDMDGECHAIVRLSCMIFNISYAFDDVVNYYGIVRTVKAFYPILKAQAKEYKAARVVNVVSMAGLVVGGFAAPYHGSKFAAEALSSCLRSELQSWNVQVVTVNPSFHETPLTLGMRQTIINMWENVPASVRDEYGEGV